MFCNKVSCFVKKNLGGCAKKSVGGAKKVETATLDIVSNLSNVAPDQKVTKKSSQKRSITPKKTDEATCSTELDPLKSHTSHTSVGNIFFPFRVTKDNRMKFIEEYYSMTVSKYNLY